MEHLHFYPDQEKILSFKPRVIFSGILNVGQNWSSGMHRHNFCEILYITSGAGSIMIENKVYPVRAGDIVVYNTGVFHDERCTGTELSILFFAIGNIRIPGLGCGCIVPDDVCPVIESGSYDNVLGSFLSLMVTELEQKKTHYKAISTSIATLFCHYILRLYEIKGEKPAHVDICEKAKQYIDVNYAKNINLDTIAASFHISKYYFVHTFKEHTGISPMKYLLFVRINAAKDLLGKTDKPIGQVAREVGYDSAQTFSRVFKNSENISPSEYRSHIYSNNCYRKETI